MPQIRIVKTERSARSNTKKLEQSTRPSTQQTFDVTKLYNVLIIVKIVKGVCAASMQHYVTKLELFSYNQRGNKIAMLAA